MKTTAVGTSSSSSSQPTTFNVPNASLASTMSPLATLATQFQSELAHVPDHKFKEAVMFMIAQLKDSAANL